MGVGTENKKISGFILKCRQTIATPHTIWPPWPYAVPHPQPQPHPASFLNYRHSLKNLLLNLTVHYYTLLYERTLSVCILFPVEWYDGDYFFLTRFRQFLTEGCHNFGTPTWSPFMPFTAISHSLLLYYTLYHEPSSLSLSQQSAAQSSAHHIKNKQQPWHKPSPCLCSLSLHTIYHRAPLIQSVLVKSIPIYFFYSFTGK